MSQHETQNRKAKKELNASWVLLTFVLLLGGIILLHLLT